MLKYDENGCCLWYPKISEIINCDSHCDLQFIANSEKMIYQKTRFDAIPFVQNDF